MVKAIEETKQNWSRYGHIVEDTKLVLRSLRQWRIGHVKQEANEAVHGLAKEASRGSMDNVWIEETPICISHIVNLERDTLSLSN